MSDKKKPFYQQAERALLAVKCDHCGNIEEGCLKDPKGLHICPSCFAREQQKVFIDTKKRVSLLLRKASEDLDKDCYEECCKAMMEATPLMQVVLNYVASQRKPKFH